MLENLIGLFCLVLGLVLAALRLTELGPGERRVVRDRPFYDEIDEQMP